MRIAILSTMAAQPWGGSEELWFRVALLARQQGHDVAVSVYKWHNPSDRIVQLQKSGVKVYVRSRLHYHSIAGKAKAKFLQKTIAVLELKAILKFAPDLLIVSQGSLVDVETSYYHTFFKQLKIPYCNIVHGNTENGLIGPNHRTNLEFVYTHASRVFFVSHRNWEVAERMLCARFTNAGIITNPIGFQDKSMVPYPINNVLQFAIVGLLDIKVKGHSILLDILKDQVWIQRNWHLNIYGMGPDESYIRSLSAFYDLKDKVTFHGHVKDLRNTIWSKNHVLLMPSSQEGCPIALVEAMVCGRSAVVSDVGGNAELVEEGVSGFIADAATPNSFGKAMEKMWDNKDKLDEMGIHAHRSAMLKLSKDPVERALEQFLSVINTSNYINSKVTT